MIKVTCYWCDAPYDQTDKPTCYHKEITQEIIDAAAILDGVNFCDHFCCNLPENLCRANRLAQALKEFTK